MASPSFFVWLAASFRYPGLLCKRRHSVESALRLKIAVHDGFRVGNALLRALASMLLLAAPALGLAQTPAALAMCVDHNLPGQARVEACGEAIARAEDEHTKFRAYANRAQAYFSLARSDLWPSDMARAIAIEPANTAAYRLRASMYSDDSKYDAAIADLNVVLAQNPDDKEALILRAYAHGALRHFTSAIADYDALVRLKPDRADTLYNRGLVHQQRRDYKRARADYARAIELDRSLSADFPAACFDEMGLFTGAAPVLKDWPACERSTRKRHNIRWSRVP